MSKLFGFKKHSLSVFDKKDISTLNVRQEATSFVKEEIVQEVIIPEVVPEVVPEVLPEASA